MLEIKKLEDLNNSINQSKYEVEDKIVLIDTESLLFNPENFYSLSNIDTLMESIKVNGLIEPIIISEDLVVISGHRRLKACIELNLKEIACRFGKFQNNLYSSIALIEANAQRIKTKDERDKEICLKKEYYTRLKEENPELNININKLLAEEYKISIGTVKRASHEAVKNEETEYTINDVLNSLKKQKEKLINNIDIQIINQAIEMIEGEAIKDD